MEFYTSSGIPRPVRLSQATRQFAWESLNHRYGKETRRTPNVPLDQIPGYPELPKLTRYNLAVREIAEKAPLRICPGELLSGAATLGDAISHMLPARHEAIARDGSCGTSHLTVDFFEVLAIGMDGIRAKAERSLTAQIDPARQEFLRSCLATIDSMALWHRRYVEALEAMPGYEAVARNLHQVPFRPARTFWEAVQSVWFCFAFLRLTGCWPGIGRIDQMLGPYLKADLAAGTVTMDQAREILAHFFIKGCEWIDGEVTWGGDAQHYQNLVLSGIDADGRDVTNEVTELVLEIVEETGISDFPISVRINRNTDEAFLRRLAEVIRYGGGIVAVYNEDLILSSLTRIGYAEREARNFANDGCWEIQIPGKTCFSYVPFDALRLLQHQTLGDYAETVDFPDFESLYAAFRHDLADQIGAIYDSCLVPLLDPKRDVPACTAISLFEHDCIERGLSYQEGGPVYKVISPHLGGLADVVNSLYAIGKAVFEEKRLTFRDMMTVLRTNWEGQEKLRRQMLTGYSYYGNGNDEVDDLAARVLRDFSDLCLTYDGRTPVRFVSGVSTFGRQMEWAPARSATPFGRKKGEILAGNLSPTPGTDHNGATAVIASCCRADLSRQYTGAALDLSFVPSNLDSDNAVAALAGLIRGFVRLGGCFMQINTVDAAVLEDAQKHPENYENLTVRVAGWSARFVTMNKQWQDMLIERAR